MLEYKNKICIKRDSREVFVIAIGGSDSAQATNIVGYFLLYELQERMPQVKRNLYRDDALFILDKSTPRKLENYKKSIHRFFNSFGLKVVIDKEHSVVNYFDVTFNLFEGTYKTYHKINENLKYVNAESNHPPSNKSALICNVSKRISNLSCNFEIFKNNADYYNKALARAGYWEEIRYLAENDEYVTKKRARQYRNDRMGSTGGVNKVLVKERMNSASASHCLNKIKDRSLNGGRFKKSNKPMMIQCDKKSDKFRTNNQDKLWLIVPYGPQIMTDLVGQIKKIIEETIDNNARLNKRINSTMFIDIQFQRV